MPASMSWRKVGLGAALDAVTTTAATTRARSTRLSFCMTRGPEVWAKYPSDRLQRLDLALDCEPLERLRLDLAHPLPRQSERPPDLLERLRVGVAVHPVPQLQDVARALREGVHVSAERLRGEADVDLLLDRGSVGGDEVAELRVAVASDRLVEARDRTSSLAHLAHLLERQLRGPRELLVGRLALELERELAAGARDLLLALDDVHGNPDRPRLVRDPALHRLADPPRRVGREFVPAPPVELLHGADQADDPILDQVEKRGHMHMVA